MTGNVRDHPWNKFNERTRLLTEASKDILHPDGKLHIFEFNRWKLLTKDGAYEVLPPGKDSPKFTLGKYHGIKTIHPIKKFKTYNFRTGEWGNFVRCHKCRYLFKPGAPQEIYCPDCREKVKEWQKLQTSGKRYAEKIRKWIALGYSTAEINLRINGLATCARCGDQFPAKKYDATHCHRCRTAIWREKKRSSP